MVEIIEQEEEKMRISAAVLASLPEWFGIPESTAVYVQECREYPFCADICSGIPRGFITLKETSPYTAEIYVMGVRKEYHRMGIGHKLFERFYDYVQKRGYLFIQVKTVKEGRCPEYDVSNAFYKSLGFREFECIDTLWESSNPCQIYIMAVT
mgnify:FL=1